MLCLGGISDKPVESWKDKIKWFLESCNLKDLDRIDGEPMEFEWKNFPGLTTVGILAEIQKMMAESKCEPAQFNGRFMSMYNDITWRERGIREIVLRILSKLENMLANSARTVIISGAWMREEMVWNPHSQTGRRMGQDC